MRLSELFLNRFLYKDNNQSSETQGADFISLDSSDTVPSSIPAGGAAQDINTSNVLINGAQLEPGTYPVTTLDVSNWGWGQTCAFSSTDLNTVSWGAGTFTSADGTSYSINAGDTGNMSTKTYIYLSLLDSETDYQISTTPGDSVGIGKVLIAVAENASDNATYMLSEATQIVGDNILANSINASKIITGQLIVGTNVGLGTAQDSTGVTTIIGNVVTTGFVNALSVVAGSVAAENITGTTITGKTINGGLIQTSASTSVDRVIISGTSNDIEFWSSDDSIIGTITPWYNPVNTAGGISFSGGGCTFDMNGKGNLGSITMGLPNSIYFGLDWFGGDTATERIVTNGTLDGDWVPYATASYNLGSSTLKWATVYAGTISGLTTLSVAGTISITGASGLNRNSISQPIMYVGYVSGTTLSKTNNSFTITNPSTGNYTITHNFNSVNHTIQVTALRASGSGAYIVKVASQGLDSFDVIVFDDGGVARDGDFMFALFKN